MGVYINMDMPTSCYDCNCFIRDSDGSDYCCLLMQDIEDNDKRDDHCPLVPVPPHGRLIDADALKETLDYYIREAGWSDEINEALTWVRDEFIDHEPTIIDGEAVSE